MASIDDRIKNIVCKKSQLEGQLFQISSSIEQARRDTERVQSSMSLLVQAKPYLDLIIENYTEMDVKHLQTLLNEGLRVIFFDKNYSVEIQVSEKRNAKQIDIQFNDNGVKVPLSTSFVGGGVLVVLGFIIQVFFILKFKRERLVFLDESFTQLSSEYIPQFMEFLKNLCYKIHMKVILITHDDRIKQYADKSYLVINGKYSES